MMNTKTGDTSHDSSKIYKIKYQINILPGIGVHHTDDGKGSSSLSNTEINWMEMLQRTEEIDIFKSKAILPFIKFKWE
jgi:hypothetical protein